MLLLFASRAELCKSMMYAGGLADNENDNDDDESGVGSRQQLSR